MIEPCFFLRTVSRSETGAWEGSAIFLGTQEEKERLKSGETQFWTSTTPSVCVMYDVLEVRYLTETLITQWFDPVNKCFFSDEENKDGTLWNKGCKPDHRQHILESIEQSEILCLPEQLSHCALPLFLTPRAPCSHVVKEVHVEFLLETLAEHPAVKVMEKWHIISKRLSSETLWPYGPYGEPGGTPADARDENMRLMYPEAACMEPFEGLCSPVEVSLPNGETRWGVLELKEKMAGHSFSARCHFTTQVDLLPGMELKRNVRETFLMFRPDIPEIVSTESATIAVIL